MTKTRRRFWILAVANLMLAACSGDDSSPTGTGGAGGAGGSGETGGTSGSGGSGGSGGTSGGTGGATGGSAGESGASGASGAGGSAGSGTDGGKAGSAGGAMTDAASDRAVTPDAIEGGRCLPAGTHTITNDGSNGYSIAGNTLNETIALCRGFKYTFAINTPGHPFFIRTQAGPTYNDGITGNHRSEGDLVFDVPMNAPDLLIYECEIHPTMAGALVIVN